MGIQVYSQYKKKEKTFIVKIKCKILFVLICIPPTKYITHTPHIHTHTHIRICMEALFHVTCEHDYIWK